MYSEDLSIIEVQFVYKCYLLLWGKGLVIYEEKQTHFQHFLADTSHSTVVIYIQNN